MSLHSHNRIDRFQPQTGELDEFCRLPAPAAGLAFDPAGTLWVTGGELGQPPGHVWRVFPDGRVEEWVQIPDALFLNGCATTPQLQVLLIAESLTGRVLAGDQATPGWTTWLESDELRSRHDAMPGADGIKVHGKRVWISVTDSDTILRADICSDGTAGELETVARGLRADDFAFSRSGAVYIATHVAQSVLRLQADGARQTIAGPELGVVGSTACAFGRSPEDRMALYVTTNGGLSLPYDGQLQDAKLVRLDVGEPGERLAADEAIANPT